MRTLPKPINSAETVFIDCINVIRSRDLKARMLACKPLINKAEKEFEEKIVKCEAHLISQELTVNGNVTSGELANLYTARMVSHEVGRIHYNSILLSAKKGLCPLCSHRDVSTLDHYLPKSLYPRLSVVPINLIPACQKCNTDKSSDYPTSPETHRLHPYFDNIENDKWLIASVNYSNPISVTFSVGWAKGWNLLMYSRVSRHFDFFELNTLYATQAGRELSGIKHQLSNVFQSGGIQSLRTYLIECSTSRAIDNLNSWQSALYAGLAANDWFCSGGFRQIA